MDLGNLGTDSLLKVGAAALGGVVLILLLARLLSRKKESPHVQRVSCTGCGWQGTVSRYAGRCPKCNNTLGERRAKR